MTKPPIPDVINDFEAWARVAAHLLRRDADEQLAILRSLELADVFPQANAVWSAALREDVARRQTTRVSRYGQLCAEEMRRRQSEAALEDTAPQDPAAVRRAVLPFRPLREMPSR
jgi:hypothetical protein